MRTMLIALQVVRTSFGNRAYMDTQVSKYHKNFMGKTIFWPWPLSTFEENMNERQNWPFSGSIDSPTKALGRPF